MIKVQLETQAGKVKIRRISRNPSIKKNHTKTKDNRDSIINLKGSGIQNRLMRQIILITRMKHSKFRLIPNNSRNKNSPKVF